MEPNIFSFQTLGHIYLEGAVTLSTSLEKNWRFFIFFLGKNWFNFLKDREKQQSGLRDEGEDIRSTIRGVI